MGAISNLCTTHKVSLYWADELPTGGLGWVGVADVACNLEFSRVAVPRRRKGPQHNEEVLHEVAHLVVWRETNTPPGQHDERRVCWLALRWAREFGFSPDTRLFAWRVLCEACADADSLGER